MPPGVDLLLTCGEQDHHSCRGLLVSQRSLNGAHDAARKAQLGDAPSGAAPHLQSTAPCQDGAARPAHASTQAGWLGVRVTWGGTEAWMVPRMRRRGPSLAMPIWRSSASPSSASMSAPMPARLKAPWNSPRPLVASHARREASSALPAGCCRGAWHDERGTGGQQSMHWPISVLAL